ncbi:hypothetical protein J6590_037266 [Homalodisca vitripennis]|nr:hypothetical protein J6590_037266 [Homalodisca vitripennis]
MRTSGRGSGTCYWGDGCGVRDSYGSLTSRLHLRCTCTCTLYMLCAYASGLNLPAAYIPGSPAALVLPTYRCAGRSAR